MEKSSSEQSYDLIWTNLFVEINLKPVLDLNIGQSGHIPRSRYMLRVLNCGPLFLEFFGVSGFEDVNNIDLEAL